MRCIFLMICFLLGATPEGGVELTEDDVHDAIIELHRSENGKYIIWRECGKRVGNPDERAREYAVAIMDSISKVENDTGFRVDPRIVMAILFRESSYDECVIGHRETKKLIEKLGRAPNKSDLLEHVTKWRDAQKETRTKCLHRSKSSPYYDECFRDHIHKKYPHYQGIKGWDIGAAQFRWPTMLLYRRTTVLPSGREVKKTTLKELMDYEVSIQYLVEDLQSHYEVCKGHTHWLRDRRGKKIRKLSTLESYWVHHHTGGHAWGSKYWRRVQRHLKVIDEVKVVSSGDKDDSTRQEKKGHI